MKGVLFLLIVSVMTMVFFSKPVYSMKFKMRILPSNILVLLILVLPCFSFARKLPIAIEQAMSKGAEAKICLKVCDDEGSPVSNASVRAEFDLLPNPHSVYGKTDSNGVVVVKGKTNGNRISFFVGKEGYYGSHKEITYIEMGKEHDVKKGKWQPEVMELSIYLRSIKKPIKLCSVTVQNYKFINEINKWIGYDFEVNDFVEPIGSGRFSDFEVYLDWDCIYSIMDCRQIGFKIRFTEPQSGFYPVQLECHSEFATPYRALTDVSFSQEAEFYDRYGGKRIGDNFDTSKCWVIRSRCKIDQYGHLVSANYAVVRFLGISGSRELKAGFCFSGAFNPTPNDTNLEDIEAANRSRDFIRQSEPPPKSKRK